MHGICRIGMEVDAHHYCGKVWLICGWIMLPVSVLVMLLVRGGSVDAVGIVGAVLCGVQIIPLVGSVILTERALSKAFDKNGIPRFTDPSEK